MRTITAVAAFALTWPNALVAQTAGEYTLVGVAFDSLNSRPLASAIVTLGALGRTTFTDESGIFRFERLAPGPVHVVVQHDALDSLGIGALTADAVVGAQTDTVRVSIPGFGAFWTRMCGTSAIPPGSAILFGSVRDAVRGSPALNAKVRVSWTTIGVEKNTLVPATWGGDTPVDANGRYSVCGVPSDATLRVVAIVDGSRTGSVAIDVAASHVRRLQLAVGVPADSTLRGSIAGTVHDTLGMPIAGATISVEGAQDVRSDSAGRFVVSDVPLGTRGVVARSVGMEPGATTVDVSPTEAARASFVLGRVTALGAVTISALSIRQLFASDLDERRALRVAKFVDSTNIARLHNLNGALTTMPSLRLTARGEPYFRLDPKSRLPCLPSIMIDKRLTDFEELQTYPLSNIGMLEIYEYDNQVPSALTATMGRRRGNTCGVIAVWTKRMFP
jgi:hypothetical protein